MDDTAIILLCLAVFSSGVIVGRVFPMRESRALGDEQRIRPAGIDLFIWPEAMPGRERARWLIAVAALLIAILSVAALLPGTA